MQDDFELLIDGRPSQITNFLALDERIRRTERLPPPPTAAGEPSVSGADSSDERPVEVEPPPLHLVIYIDNIHIRPENRKWVIENLRRVVPSLTRTGDAVMLVTYDRRPIVRQPFTTDSKLILAAIDEAEMLTAGGAALDLDRRRALEEIDLTQNQVSASRAARSYAEYLSSEVRFSMAGLSDFTSSLAGIPGRKALIYVSDGLPLVAAEELFVAIDDRFGISSGLSQAFTYDFTRNFDRLSGIANSSGVTFYTLDAKGLQVDESVGADAASFKNIRSRTVIEATRKNNLAAPLKILAEDTGGQSIIGTNALIPALERVIDDFTTYYSLGYMPTTADGRLHDIEVRVKNRPELKVRHRDGFRLKDPQSRLLDVTGAALEYGVERSALGTTIEFTQPTPKGDGLYQLPVQIRIPLGRLTLIPNNDATAWVGQIQVAIGTMATNGEKAPAQAQPTHRIEIPNADLERAKASFYTYELPIVVRSGTQRVGIGVRDEIGGLLDTKAEIVTIR
jgi:VWFA-related protein